ncbi:hypothetical protein RQP46_006761 [Phenoliferia psychrophenolica]
MPLQRSESASKDAQTREETEADTHETFGVLNQHPAAAQEAPAFRVGVASDQNRKSRRSMEDAHSFIYDFGGIRGQGYFAVFDGHAGKACAEWCGEHFHEHLLEALLQSPTTPIPDVLNATFHAVDKKLSELAVAGGTHSGCTAVTAFLRLEDEDGNPVGNGGGVGSGVAVSSVAPDGSSATGADSGEVEKEGEGKTGGIGSKIKGLLNGSSSGGRPSAGSSGTEGDAAAANSSSPTTSVTAPVVQVNGPAEVKKAAKRTLYTANAGDARAVLSRGGRAVRLTYDHKGSDAKEAKRITDAGGFVMNNRVNGVLAVTRSLGDSSMKEFVVGSPYTTETTLGPEDEFLIIACDGLWDVCQDQEAVDICRQHKDPQAASRALLDHALNSFSSDNITSLVISLLPPSAATTTNTTTSEADAPTPAPEATPSE